MTNHWIDFQNSDCILIMGSNPASNHPVSFKWITKAMEKGATLICVDPRFTQSAAKAHIYAPLRSGTDIAFLGGMIKYILDNQSDPGRVCEELHQRRFPGQSGIQTPRRQ